MPELSDISPYIEGLYQSSVLQDWAQTRKIARNPDNFYEKKLSGVIGEHPSQRDVNKYMAARMLGHYALDKALPENYKIPFELLSLAEVAKTVNDNRKLGLEINKPSLLLGALLTGWLNKNKSMNIQPTNIEGTPGLVFNRNF